MLAPARARVDAWDPRFAAFRAVAQTAARDPRVARLASRLAGINDINPPLALARRIASLSAADLRREQCAMLLRAVQSRVAYVDSPFSAPLVTWARGLGDCKSSAVLLCALALSLGCSARLMAMGWDGEPSHVACQLKPTPDSPWLWAETTLPAELGEHPSDALERVDPPARADLAPRRVGAVALRSKAKTSRATQAQHAYAGHVLSVAFRQAVGRAASVYERQLLQAVALTETSYGRGWNPPCQDSHNWGSVHATNGAPSCSYSDSYPDGERYDQGMRVYPSDYDGAADFVALIYKHMPGVRRALEKQTGIRDFSRAMVFSHYAGSVCPNALAKFGSAVHDATQFWPVLPGHRATTEAGKACEDEAIARHAAAIRDAAYEIADALHEPRPPFDSPASSWVVPVAVGALVVGAGGLAYYVAKHPREVRRAAA